MKPLVRTMAIGYGSGLTLGYAVGFVLTLVWRMYFPAALFLVCGVISTWITVQMRKSLKNAGTKGD